MKFLKWLGIIACIVLIIVCFLPWTYHADIDKTFTGFISEKDKYGKPGKFIIFFCLLSIILLWLPKISAKKIQLFVAGVLLSYAIKTYILFTSCYNAYCPEKRYGIFLVLACSVVIMIASIFPDVDMTGKQKNRATN
ncbi:MAG: hypothetical protein JWQ27_2273 [Ferruginibacter sp.]|nr:hypothetical protein [Ferruginibacter sp.]